MRSAIAAISAIATAAMLWHGSTHAQALRSEAFQGLNWGDDAAAIQRAFPDAVPATCRDQHERDFYAGLGWTCGLVTRGYRADAFTFNAFFRLTKASGQLVSISLQTQVNKNADPAASRGLVVTACDQLRQLLTGKYGPGRQNMNMNSADDLFFTYQWSPSSATNVFLVCSDKKGTASSTMMINYDIAPNSGSGKL